MADEVGTTEELMDRKLKRRTYMRNMMRQYKKDRKMEVVYLKGLQERLEADLQNVAERQLPSRASTLELPWEEVARAFSDARRQETIEQDDLKAEVLEYASLVRDMQRWVAVQTSVPISLNAHIPTWRFAHLPSNPRSRALGKEWITQRMYHNIERVFRDHDMPPPSASSPENFEFLLTTSEANSTYDYFHRHQFVSSMPPSVIAATYRHMLCAMLLVDRHDTTPHSTRHEVDGATAMHQVTTSKGEHVNLLTREFHEGDRVVFVAQQIRDDESSSSLTDCPQRHRSLWVEVTPMPSNVSVVRVMYMYSQLFRGDEPCSLEEESSYWDFDPQTQPEHAFPQHARRTAQSFLPSSRQRVRGFVEKTIIELSATPSH